MRELTHKDLFCTAAGRRWRREKSFGIAASPYPFVPTSTASDTGSPGLPLGQVMTSHFDINSLFFLRFDHVAGEDTFHLTKEMHLAKLHNPHGTVSEHFCRRLVAITILRELAAHQQMGV